MGDVAGVIVLNGAGEVLLGLRDGDEYTIPAGHLNPGEDPLTGALRELFEEAGYALKPEDLTPVLVQPLRDSQSLFYLYSTVVSGEPTAVHDPDEEFSEFKWVDCKDGIPPDILWNLAYPGEHNVLHQLFQKSEVNDLLRHPDPVERRLALKLDSVTPAQLGLGLLDPDEHVFQDAFHHVDSPLHVLSQHTHDLSGNPIGHRHALLLSDPRLEPDHVENMYFATAGDQSQDPLDLVKSLRIIGAHPLLPMTARLLAAADYGMPVDLRKAEWAHAKISQQPEHLADYTRETTPPHLHDLAEAYHQHVNSARAIEPQNAKADGDIHQTGDLSPKVIYKIPHGQSHKRVMVKPYTERDMNGAATIPGGWSENTNQALYHAAGIGHLHQRTFTAQHGVGKYAAPAQVMEIEPAQSLDDMSPHERTPEVKHQARQIATMDFLTGNADRHEQNLLHRPDSGNLLAIDHATNTNYSDNDEFIDYAQHGGPHRVAGGLNEKGWPEALQWAAQNGDKLKDAHESRLALLKDPAHAEDLRQHFNRRLDWVKARAPEAARGEPQWWQKGVY